MNSAGATTDRGFLTRFAGVPVLLILLIVVLLGTALRLSSGELKGEEGRRAIAASEMISSGDWLVPTVWGQAYLNKPPGYPWLVAISSQFTGGVNPLAVRIPAFLAFAGLAVVLFFLGRRWGGVEGGLLTSFFLVASIEMQKKAMIGETDMLLTFGISLYALALWDRDSTWKHGVCGSIGLIIAGFAKGPAVLPFVAGLSLARFIRDGYSHRLLAVSATPVLVMIVALLAWYLPLQSRLAGTDVWSHWQAETTRQRLGETSIFSGRHLFELVTGGILGFLPASLILLEPRKWLASCQKNGWGKTAALSTILIPFSIFFLWPEPQPRYLLPLMPIFCSWAGLYFFNQQEGQSIRIFSLLLRMLLFSGAVYVLYEAWFSNREDLSLATGQSVGLSVWALVALVLVMIPLNRCKIIVHPAMSRIFLIMFSFSVVQLAWIVPLRSTETPAGDFSNWVEQRVPESATIWLSVDENWNELAMLPRSLKWKSMAPPNKMRGWLMEESNEPAEANGWRLPSGTWVTLKPWSGKGAK